jgi:sulfate adenylyltransferase
MKPGLALFLTGLSGAGKSTLASALGDRITAATGRPVTLLDGDAVRAYLSSELGFTREHRDLNVRRIGFVAAEVARHGGITICAAIAPYAAARAEVRHGVARFGNFVEVHVSTALSVCESRDVKGLYAKARAGMLSHFTGIDDPYEVPVDAELSIDTAHVSPDQAVDRLMAWLQHRDFL